MQVRLRERWTDRIRKKYWKIIPKRRYLPPKIFQVFTKTTFSPLCFLKNKSLPLGPKGRGREKSNSYGGDSA